MADFTGISPVPDMGGDKLFIKKVKEWQTNSLTMHRPWLREFEISNNGYLGNQWTASEVRTLEDEGRPHFVWNLIRPLVNLVAGMHAQTRFNLRPIATNAAEDGVAEVIDKVIRHIEFRSGYQVVGAQAFLDGVVGGRGWRGGYIDFSDNPLGEIRYEYIPPQHILYDYNAVHADLRDAEYLLRSKWFSETQFEQFFPNIGKSERSELFDPQEWPEDISFRKATMDRKRRRVMEVWWREQMPKWIAIDPSTLQRRLFKDRAEAQTFAQGSQSRQILINVSVTIIRAALITGNRLLDDIMESPYGHREFPYFPYFSHWIQGETFGLVKDLIDPQRHFNKTMSQALHIVNTSSNVPVLIPDGTDNPEDVARQMNTSGGHVTYDPNIGPPSFGDRPPIPNEIFTMIVQAQQLMREVPGINPALMGLATEKRESGRAAALRQQQGSTVLAQSLGNWRNGERCRGRWTIDAIQRIMKAPQTMRIIGESDDASEPVQQVSVNQPVFDHTSAAIRIENDLSLGEFDIRIDEVPQTATLRMSQFTSLVDALNAGIPIPPEFIIDYIPGLPMAARSSARQAIKQQQELLAQQAAAGGPSPPPNAVAART